MDVRCLIGIHDYKLLQNFGDRNIRYKCTRCGKSYLHIWGVTKIPFYKAYEHYYKEKGIEIKE